MTNTLLVQYGGMSRRSTFSPPCAKVQMALVLKGIEFDVFNCKTPGDIKKYNSRGRVPALKIDDEVFVDSSDILTEIDRRWPDPPLLPADPAQRAQCHLLEDWADDVLYFQAVWLRWMVPESFEAMRTEYFGRLSFPLSKLAPILAMRSVRSRLSGQGTGLKPEKTIRRELREGLEMLEQLLEPAAFLVGDQITRADLAVAAVLDQFDAPINPASNRIDYSDLPNLRAWFDRVHECTPSVV